MSNTEFAVKLSLVLVILTHGWGNAQTRTTPTPQRDASQQSITTQRVQPQAPSQANVSRYEQQNFDIKPSPDDAKRFYKQGVKYGQLKLYTEALSAFELAVLLKPNYIDAYFGLGDTYFDMGRWRDASRAFRRVIQLNPKDEKAYARLRQVNAKLASEDKAPKTKIVEENNTPTAARVSLQSGSQSNVATRVRPKYATRNSGPTQKDSPSWKQSATQLSKTTVSSTSKPVATRPAPSLTPSNSQPGREPVATASGPRTMSGVSSVKSTSLKASASGGTPSVTAATAKPEPTSSKPPVPASTATSESTSRKTPGSATAVIRNPGPSEAKPVPSPDNAKTLVAKVTTKKSVETASSTPTNSGSEVTKTTATAIKEAETAGPKEPSTPTPVMPSAGTAAAPMADKEPAVPPPTISAVDPDSSSVKATEASETANYRVGAGDVLDIRVSESPLNTPTQFTVSAGGLLDYPALPQPFKVLGLTTDEVGQLLGNELKRLALSDKKVTVAVSDYNSHTVLISGLVNEHGTKVLRREAIPLYVVLADAQPLPEAGRVTVISRDQKITNVDLAIPEATALLIRHGDVVVVQANPKLFFYIGGDVKEPGEKPFRQGLKLTQAILLAGGLTRVSKSIELAREGASGRLELSVYKLTDINSGQLPDPPIQPGDRITIVP